MSKNKINIPRDCNLTNALCFATYKMLNALSALVMRSMVVMYDTVLSTSKV